MAELLERLKIALSGRYEIEREIGRGGSATVFLARDLKHPRSVAIKVLKPELAAVVGPERFLKEIEITSSFTHPHILLLLDSGTTDGLLYYIMPYVEGESLRDRLNREKQLPVEDAIGITRDVARALEYAHEHGVLHRDIKPENILLEAGEAVVADFGIARAFEGGEGLTATGVAIGTPAYMSPEQASGEAQLDARSDLYSLGCVFYEMLAGKPPFSGPTAESILNQHRTAAAPPVATIRPSCPEGIEGTLSHLLAKTPADRYATAHQLTESLRPISEQSSATQQTSVDRRKRARLGAGAIIVAVAILLVGLNVGGLRDRLFGGAARAEIGSLAVLPLEDLSRDPEQEYFADGMTEALTAELGKIHSLMVISRTSAMQYKGTEKSIPEIGRELNVDAVVEGSILRVGERVRITAQLIHAPTDRHLWAENYERDFGDVMTLQGEVARDIARQVQAELTPREEASFADSRPVNPAALDAYLQGRFAANRRTDDGFRDAIEYYEQAIRLDANYARAYVGLSLCYGALGAWNVIPPEEAIPQAKAAVMRALELDETLAEAHSRLSWIHRAEWDWQAAEREAERALELDPNSAGAQAGYSTLLSITGQHDEAIARMRRGLELNPLSAGARIAVGIQYYMARRYDDAIDFYEEALEMGAPDAHYRLGEAYLASGMHEQAIAEFEEYLKLAGDVEATAVLGWAYAAAGKRVEARRILEEIIERAEHEYVSAQSIACIYSTLGDKDLAFEWLERACQRRSPILAWLKVAPYFDPLRSDPRYEDLLRRVGLADES